VADSFDNALAETINGLYKAECVYGRETSGSDDVSHLELATLSWVSWFNTERPHSCCKDRPPAEFEASCNAPHQAGHTRLESQAKGLHQTQDASICCQVPGRGV
jgi:putative transposase